MKPHKPSIKNQKSHSISILASKLRAKFKSNTTTNARKTPPKRPKRRRKPPPPPPKKQKINKPQLQIPKKNKHQQSISQNQQISSKNNTETIDDPVINNDTFHVLDDEHAIEYTENGEVMITELEV